VDTNSSVGLRCRFFHVTQCLVVGRPIRLQFMYALLLKHVSIFRSKVFSGGLLRAFSLIHVDLMFCITWKQLEADQKAENHHTTTRESPKNLHVSAWSEARDHVPTVRSRRL